MMVASLAQIECSAYQPKSVFCHIQIDYRKFEEQKSHEMWDKPHLKVWTWVKSDSSLDSLVASIRFFKLSFASLAAWHAITMSNPERRNGQPNNAAQGLCSMIVRTRRLCCTQSYWGLRFYHSNQCGYSMQVMSGPKNLMIWSLAKNSVDTASVRSDLRDKSDFPAVWT